MDLVRMRLRKSGGGESEKERVTSSRSERPSQSRPRPIWEAKKEENARSDLNKIKLERKRKKGENYAAGDLRRQMVLDKAEKRVQDEKRILTDLAEKRILADLAEKRAKIKVFAMLGLTEEAAMEVKKENLRSQQQKASDQSGKVEELDKEETLLMEMQDIFDDLHDLS